ncbi:hypothetical protein ACKC9G_05545 [Pokkaliibacter sp. CJK22405]|uniref:hypothetical protein n=1 Tax=Pokkaliibacter sp. CJK22405 TaxID=3384615 RepID=UPI0039848F76
MKKLTAIATVVVVAAAGGAWWWTTNQEGNAEIAAYVPADTILYASGYQSKDVDATVRSWPLWGTLPPEMSQIVDQLGEKEATTPLAKLGQFLLADFRNNAATYGDFYDHYGIDATQPSALYFDGIAPVMRFTLSQPTKLQAVISQASEKSGLKATTETLDGHSVQVWRSEKEDKGAVALLIENNTATFSVFFPGEDQKAQLQRLALVKPEKSIESSGELAALQQKHDKADTVAVFHVDRLVKALLQPESAGLAGKQIVEIIKQSGKPDPFAAVSGACRKEYVEMAGYVPQITLFSESSAQDGGVHSSLQSTWEITSKNATATLGKLRGHLPAHGGDKNSAFSFGLGLEVSQLAPVLTDAWTQFTQAKFECDELVKAQQAASQTSPAMLGMFTGMLQGVKGLGISVYNLTAAKEGPGAEADVLLSVASENPQQLASMIASSPFTAGVQIPVDGTFGDISLGTYGTPMTVKAGIAGHSLVLFSGEQATAQVEKLKSESLDANGLFSMGIDYSKLADLVENAPIENFTPEYSDEYGPSACVQKFSTAQMLRTKPIQLSYLVDAKEAGLTTDIDMLMKKPQVADSIKPAGSYRVFDQTYDCGEGDDVGTETINSDGTGTYEMKDVEGKCVVSRITYQWKQEGNQLTMSNGKTQYRDSCEAEWPAATDYSANCTMMPVSGGGFRCLIDEAEGQSLYFYRPEK